MPLWLFGTIHTNPFSNENGAVLLRIWLSSTLQRQKRSPKTEQFENALQSWAIWKNDAFWKRCFLVLTKKTMQSENDDVIKIDMTGRQTTRPWVSKMADRRFAPIWRADILKCAWVSSLAHAHWGYKSIFKTDTAISVDANLFENGAKQLRFRLKLDKCGWGLIFQGIGAWQIQMDGQVTNKIFEIDGLTNFLRYSTPLAGLQCGGALL